MHAILTQKKCCVCEFKVHKAYFSGFRKKTNQGEEKGGGRLKEKERKENKQSSLSLVKQ